MHLCVASFVEVAVAVEAEIDATVVVGLLHEVIEILGWAIIQVQYIVDNPVGFVLSVGETVLSIEAVATIISTVLYVSERYLIKSENFRKLITIY